MPSKYLSKLQDNLVIIIGGTSGIGYGVAEACIEFGASVVIASRSQSKVSNALSSLKSSYPDVPADKIRGQTIDLNTLDNPDVEAHLVKLFDFATGNGGRKVNHIVETAGDLELRGKLTLETVTPDLMAQAASVRVVGVVLLAKVAGKYLDKSYKSSITMTSGASLYRPRPGFSPFLLAAGGKESFTKGLAADMTPVRVNLVSPGAIETPLLYTIVKDEAQKAAFQEMFKKMNILERIGTVEDVVEAYLCSMRSGFQTGTTIQCEGGYLIK